jgi:hypothetical protein
VIDKAFDAAIDVCIRIDRGEFPHALNNGAACAKAIKELKLERKIARG